MWTVFSWLPSAGWRPCGCPPPDTDGAADVRSPTTIACLVTAEMPEVLWQASATLARWRFGERRFVDAAQAYDRAIENRKERDADADCGPKSSKSKV